jgi:hypothetical protein
MLELKDITKIDPTFFNIKNSDTQKYASGLIEVKRIVEEEKFASFSFGDISTCDFFFRILYDLKFYVEFISKFDPFLNREYFILNIKKL